MIDLLFAAALALQPAPAGAAPIPDPITLDERALLRCAAAFAVVANGQASGDPGVQQWPALGTRGREFFVRAMAQLMDTSGIDRAAIAQLASKEAQTLVATGEIGKIMPACLLMLESSGV